MDRFTWLRPRDSIHQSNSMLHLCEGDHGRISSRDTPLTAVSLSACKRAGEYYGDPRSKHAKCLYLWSQYPFSLMTQCATMVH